MTYSGATSECDGCAHRPPYDKAQAEALVRGAVGEYEAVECLNHRGWHVRAKTSAPSASTTGQGPQPVPRP